VHWEYYPSGYTLTVDSYNMKSSSPKIIDYIMKNQFA